MRLGNDEKHPTAARFHTTHWSVVLSAGDLTAPEAEESLAALCETVRSRWPCIDCGVVIVSC